MNMMRGTAGARPSRTMSAVAAVVVIGMMIAVASFFVAGPLIGAMVFVGVWLLTAGAIAAYHIKNATSDKGVDHTQFHFQAHSDRSPRPSDFDEHLRDLEQLRTEGLITPEEYDRKRADILAEDW